MTCLQKNEVVYDMRTQKLEQPKRRTTTYGLRTFSYLGSKLWNLLASEYSEVNDVDYERLKFLIKYWAGPNHDSAQGHFLWSTFCVLHVCFRNHFFVNLIAHTLRAGDCQFDSFVVTGGTVSCHYDKLRCHRWWQGCRVDDLSFSKYDIALYILALFICRILAFWLMLFVVHTTLNKFYLILSYIFEWPHRERRHPGHCLPCFTISVGQRCAFYFCSTSRKDYSWPVKDNFNTPKIL